MSPRVTIIVPCLNEADAIEGFLRSVLSQQDVPGGFEVIVADGISNDGTREFLLSASKSDARLRIVDNPKRTVSCGLNLATNSAQGEFIVRMDAHSLYATDYIAECVRALESSGADNVGGAARTLASGYFQRANAAAYRSFFSVGGARFHDPEYEGFVDTVTYGCWRKVTLQRLGMFDESLVRNQDDELNLRLINSGGRIWQSKSIVSWYFPRSTIKSLFRQYFQYGFWKVRVMARHRAPAAFRQVVPIGALLLGASLLGLGFLYRPAWILLVALAGFYGAIAVVASTAAANTAGDFTLLPVLPIVFATYHMSYGLGFAYGLLSALAGASAGTSTTSLSR